MTQKDPVCNMMMDEKKAQAQYISRIDGQKIYLCSAHCKSQFDLNPGKYEY
jgi:YHS domain-containing protein